MKHVLMLLAVLFFAFVMPNVGKAENININIGIPSQSAPPPAPGNYDDEPLTPLYEDDDQNYDSPPPLAFDSEPEMVVVPSGDRYVYMVPNYPGIYFYGGHWYRHHRGYWFRSSIYNGDWAYVGVSLVPRFVRDVPPEYVTYLPPTYHRIHYREFHRGWRGWERDRHWHGRDWYKHERRPDIRRERFSHIRSERDRIRHDDSGRRDHDRIRRDGGRRDHDKGRGPDRDGGRVRDHDKGRGPDRDSGRVRGAEGSKGPGPDGGRVRGSESGKGPGRDGGHVKGEGGKGPGRDSGRVKGSEGGKKADPEGKRPKRGEREGEPVR